MKKILFVLCCAAYFGCSLCAQNLQNLDQNLINIKNKYKLVGLSVLIVKDNQVIYSKGFGSANLSLNIPVNGDSTLYRIASISKTAAATAIMQLYELGKVDLNADVSQYLGFTLRNPRYPDDIITIKQLLTHTSSLQDGSGYNSFLSAAYGNNPPPIKNLLLPTGNYFTANMWGSYRPSTNFEYCNCAFGVIGTIIEKVSGKRFDIYCKQNIFDKLGMLSSFNVLDIDVTKLAVLYRNQIPQYDNYGGVKPAPRDLSHYTIGDNGLLFSPQGGLRTSTLELAKFMIAHMSNGIYNGIRILNDTTAKLMHKICWSGSGMGGYYKKKGLGFHITDDLIPGQTLIGHSGEAYGLISDMYFDQNSHYGIIFMTNGGNYTSGSRVFYAPEEEVFSTAYDALKNSLGTEMNNNFPDYSLSQNYPNPFNPSTKIRFSLPNEARVKIILYDVFGREFKIIADGNYKPGYHDVSLNGNGLASGAYYYKLEVSGEQNYSQVKKMILVR